MKNALWSIGGVAGSVAYVLLVGYLTIQVSGLAGGAVFGLDNRLTGVTEPGPGLLQLALIAGVSGVTLLILTRAVRNLGPASRFALRLGFAAATAVQIVAAFVMLSQRFEVLDLNTGPAPWVEGWLAKGGTASVVHLMLIVAVALLVAERARAAVTPPRTAPQASSEPAQGLHP
ncbi:hypothetical protein [Pseudoclavibacter sp. 8L]|uniref:hypothetical protein n=1 Tax=Pseudoclavibacter sp. 8L TaxID=2653162 RepID=UPI0012F22387|nr:hypothetical protein [Pseudoclavibacter sp. 8L]VXC38193.1 conserved membrane hypothetical protein [Pseudoclavibacter sp. 8L]